MPARGPRITGRARSRYFRTLVDRIERSDVIVYVRVSPRLRDDVDGQLQFVTAVRGARYLHINLRGSLAAPHVVAILGHELMHAVEVANAQAVTDLHVFRQLYNRIGHSHDGVAYDTRAAVEAGRRVLLDLRAIGPDH